MRTRSMFFILFALMVSTVAAQLVETDADRKAMVKHPSFLTNKRLPNGAVYLPAPPDTASLRFFNDWAQYNWGKSVRGTERGRVAYAHASMNMDSILTGFAPALGCLITRDELPETYRLLEYVKNDACKATELAKEAYMRKRPFVQFSEHTLIPGSEASHASTGSFPSSHASTGWALALVLVELAPEHQDAILIHGYEYGQSRVIAGYHYQSDVDAGRLAASAAVARIHAEPDFLRQMAKACHEWEEFQRRGRQ